ncbi:MAG: hypothetical protein WBL28_03100 [Methylotenera sp.]
MEALIKSTMSHIAVENGVITRRTTQAVLNVRSQGVQRSQALIFNATPMGQGFASGLHCQTPREGNNHSTRRFSRIPSRKAIVVAMWGLISASLWP